jgi:4-amino-4-deoxychorismate lyase
MAWHFALMIDPADSGDTRSDFAGTFTEVDPAAPALTVGELSTQRGDGIFESIGVIDGHAQEVEAHLSRLGHSARLCDLPHPHPSSGVRRSPSPPPRAEPAKRSSSSSSAAASSTARRRPPGSPPHRPPISRRTWSRHPRRHARPGVRARRASRAPWLLLGAKTLSYAVNMAALREAHRRGADDAIFTTSDGYVLEAPTASLILRRGDVFVTPAPNAGILHGTTQLSLFEHLEARGFETGYETIPVSELQTADAAWLVSSVRLAAPVTAIDERELAGDAALTASMNAYLLSPRD